MRFADGMFREVEKLDTDISPSWLRAAFLVSYLSIVVTLALGSVYFGTYSHIDNFCFVFAYIVTGSVQSEYVTI